jgi:hypothetical protein
MTGAPSPSRPGVLPSPDPAFLACASIPLRLVREMQCRPGLAAIVPHPSAASEAAFSPRPSGQRSPAPDLQLMKRRINVSSCTCRPDLESCRGWPWTGTQACGHRGGPPLDVCCRHAFNPHSAAEGGKQRGEGRQAAQRQGQGGVLGAATGSEERQHRGAAAASGAAQGWP